MLLFLIAVAASALCATANLLDRGLVHGAAEDADPLSLLAIGGALNIAMAFPLSIWVMSRYGLNLQVFLPLFLNGIVYCAAIWLYLSCLKTEDTSRVIPFFQIIPIFGIGLAFVRLNELPVPMDLFGIVCLVMGGLSLSIKEGVVHGKLAVFMVLSSALVALNDVIFAEFGRGHAFSEAILADWVGKGFFGLTALVLPLVRKGFVTGLKSKMGLMVGSEVSYAMGDALLDIAKLIMPVSIAQAAFCTQPLFVFIGIVLLSAKVPSLKEDFRKKEIRNKLVGTILMVVGGIVLSI